MKLRVVGLPLLSAFAVFATAPAHAQNGPLTRSFVSSAGVDTNPCTITAPCATFAHAYTVVGPDGIVAALDPGKYGALTITSPVTINGNGWAAITGTSGNNAISITATSGNVTLIGLELDGAGSGKSGIQLTSSLSASATLNIRDCHVSNFLDSGIAIQPTMFAGTPLALTIFIANTSSLNNGVAGIEIAPTNAAIATGVITDSNVANNKLNGIAVGGTSEITVLNSVVSANGNYGVYANVSSNGYYFVMRDTTSIGNNSWDFYSAGGTAYIYHNTLGAMHINGGTVASDGTNVNVFVAPNIAPTHQVTY